MVPINKSICKCSNKEDLDDFLTAHQLRGGGSVPSVLLDASVSCVAALGSPVAGRLEEGDDVPCGRRV